MLSLASRAFLSVASELPATLEVELSEEIGESGVGAETVEARIDFEEDQAVGAILDGLIQPVESAVVVIKCDVDGREDCVPGSVCKIRRRRSLISAQGSKRSENLGYPIKNLINPERVWRLANPYRVRT